MRRLEAQFGEVHPDIEGYQPPAEQLKWLAAAFFRLHKRRQHSESGLQPLSHYDIVNFSEKVLNLPREYTGSFTRIIEETDNAVLHDFYTRRSTS